MECEIEGYINYLSYLCRVFKGIPGFLVLF